MNKDFRYDKLILIAILTVFIGKAVYYFNHFPIPMSDFFAFKSDGLKLIKFRLPPYLTRAPLYSILIAIGSLVSPSRQAIFFSAKMINFISGITGVFLISLISKKMGLKYYLIPTWLFAIYPMTTLLTSQPLLEIVLVLGMFCPPTHKRVLVLFTFDPAQDLLQVGRRCKDRLALWI